MFFKFNIYCFVGLILKLLDCYVIVNVELFEISRIEKVVLYLFVIIFLFVLGGVIK